jgi:hypothetical protein
MKRALIFLGVATACAACCAIPTILQLLAIGVAGAAWFSPQLALLLAAALALATVAMALAHHRKAKLGKRVACGCGSSEKEPS